MITTCHGQHDARNLGEICRAILLLGIILTSSSAVFAQLETATVSGVITDQSGGIVVGAEVRVTNADTNLSFTTTSNQSGIYLVTGLKPGRYRVHVAKEGFKGIDLTDLILSVQDSISRNFSLQLGSVSETISVEGGVSLINTESAAVSTVVDHKYIENMPLNGRSFQDLILLTPGVVTKTPQLTGNNGGSGEFSVNGQRTEANYYMVDGVSANAGMFPGDAAGPELSGSVALSTALGTTQGLVSVDALEEFRVQSSTYSAEYGRNPGGQFSFVTRSGTNQWHGTAFDYLRNDAFDANDWFNNYFGKAEPPLRQNDFGGTLGGPLQIPRVYRGKDKTFFFFSYEGLRLVQPQAATVSYAPTSALRQSAPSALQPVLNAFPIPNGRDLGNGMGEFIGAWSNPGQLDSVSVRFDHAVNDKLRFFFRFSDTSSSTQTRQTASQGGSPATNLIVNYTASTYTLGATSWISSRVSNEFRLNYNSNRAASSFQVDSFAGGQAVNLTQLQGISAGTDASYLVEVALFFPGSHSALSQGPQYGLQRQWNLVDTLSLPFGRHHFKFGTDYRRGTPFSRRWSPFALYDYFTQTAIQSNAVDFGLGQSQGAAYPVYINFSAFAQDELRVAPRLNLSMGLRWEVNPAPGAATGNLPYVVRGNSLSSLTLAPQGTPLWNTTWYNFAPRLGATYVFRNTPGLETIIRGGGGVFFDTAQQDGSQGYQGIGFSAVNPFVSSAFPVPLAQVSPPIVNPPVAPYRSGPVYAFPPHLQLPYTLEWNVSLQQGFGKSQALTASYVGSNGRRLLQQNAISVAPFNPNFGRINFFRTGFTSDYNALQLQFQRKLSLGLTALTSYTWSHSIDYGSQNTDFPAVRGNSNFDVRHNFSAASSYDFPSRFQSKPTRTLLNHWGLDDRLTARSGFPIIFQGPVLTDPTTGQVNFAGLNLVPGMPLYIYDSKYPGGRTINPNAFGLPPGCTRFSCSNTAMGNAPRNFVRGFGAWQMDLAVRREFPIYEEVKLQFRAEAFNIFNHPSFGRIDSQFGNTTFGQATATLAQSLGVLSPLYQMGGARSMQFALRLKF